MPDAPKDFSTTPASNSSVNGINIAEGSSAAQLNDAIRATLAVIANPDFGTGSAFKVDAIAESTAAAGVTIDGLTIKDGGLVGGLSLPSDDPITDSNGNELVKFSATASAVKEITITNAATAGTPAISATGDTTDVSLNLVPKGAGVIQANGITIAGLLQSAQVFTSSGTWTRPSGCKRVRVRVVGGGAGGGSSGSSASSGGAGGGAGGYAESILDVTAISSSTITIGAGGAAASAGGNSSWADGTNTITANGGSAGASNITEISNNSGTAGGSASGGNVVNLPGGRGGAGGAPNSRGIGGHGGSNPLGQGAGAVYRGSTGGGDGAAGSVYGGGGSGSASVGANAATGGAGANGIIIVEEYY